MLDSPKQTPSSPAINSRSFFTVSDTLQVISPHSCKTNRLMLYIGFFYNNQ